MKAWRYDAGFGFENLKIVEVPSPEPGYGQALIRVRACSLNYRDLAVLKGQYGGSVKPPLIPLSDGAGEVVAVGPGVTRVKPGDRVAGIFMQTWLEGPAPDEAQARSALGGAIDGMLSEQVLLSAEGLVSIPAHLSFEEAATLPCAAVTAWNALCVSGAVKPGDTVLTLGSGGVSTFAIRFAKMAGARVLATTGSENKVEELRALGADQVINYRSTPEWSKPVRQLTGRGVDHVIEVGGAGTLPQSVKAVRRGGHIALIGVLGGPREFDPRLILLNSIRLQGIFVGSRAMFEDMNKAIVLADLKPVIDRIFPFADFPSALTYLESGAHFGKVCISLD